MLQNHRLFGFGKGFVGLAPALLGMLGAGVLAYFAEKHARKQQ
jgi:hypothetical protein